MFRKTEDAEFHHKIEIKIRNGNPRTKKSMTVRFNRNLIED